MIRLAGSFSPAGSTRRVLLRSLPRPPTAVFPPDGPCLHPNGGGAVHALAAALRRRRAPGKGRWRGLARVSARMPPYPLPARAREMHVRVQRRAKKRGAGRWPAPLAARADRFSSALPRWNGGSLVLPAYAPAERVGSRRETRKGVLADRQSRQTVRERSFAQRSARDIPPRIRIPAALDRLPGPRALAGTKSQTPPLRGLNWPCAPRRRAASDGGAEWRMRASALPSPLRGLKRVRKRLRPCGPPPVSPPACPPLSIGARRFF